MKKFKDVRKVIRDGFRRKFPLFGASSVDGQTYESTVWVTNGGWSQGWVGAPEIKAALDRWTKRSYETAVPEEVYPNWQPFQCGGCRSFLALDGDYGLCSNRLSVNDGRVVFEHGGCGQHSHLVEIKARERDDAD